MIRGSRTALVLAAIAGIAPSPLQQVRDGSPVSPPGPNVRATATMSGTVLVAGPGNEPARRVRVMLNDVDRRVPGQTTTTDDAGSFRFTDVPAGRFELQTSRNGFLRSSYGASRPERPGTPIVVHDGDALSRLVLTIAHGGVITGIVRDRQGRPVPDTEVRVLRLGYSSTTGEPALAVPAGSTINRTDDRGEYRAFGLPPGGYLVMASPTRSRNVRGNAESARILTSADVQRALQAPRAGQPVLAPPVAGSSSALVDYAPVFFPDVTDISRATTVALGLSEERGGVDIVVERVPTSTISGTLSSPAGPWPAGLSVTVRPNGSSASMLAGVPGLEFLATTPRPDGTYSIGGVIPGNYIVKASNSTGSARGSAGSDGSTMSGSAEASVDGRDIVLPITLTPGTPITGHLVFEGARPTQAELQTMTFQVAPVGSGGTILATGGGRIDGAGQFTFASVPVDSYYLLWTWNASGASARWSITAAVANGRDAFETPLRVGAGRPVDLTVTFTDRPATLRGVFQDRGGRAATDYFVLAFPADRALWVPASRRIRTTRPATDGTFEVRGLPPGEYLIGALTDLEPGEWNDPTLLAELAKAAIKVTIREGQTTTQDIRLGGG